LLTQPEGSTFLVLKFATGSTPVLGPTQTPIQWVRGVKWPRCEADHSPPFSAEFKNAWSYTSTPICLLGVVFN